jgi:hypothetical protein
MGGLEAGMSDFDKAWAAYLKRQHILIPSQQTFRHGWNAALVAAGAVCEDGSTVDANGEGEDRWYSTGHDYANAVYALEVEVQT